jgi:hypothetical protein
MDYALKLFTTAIIVVEGLIIWRLLGEPKTVYTILAIIALGGSAAFFVYGLTHECNETVYRECRK